MAFARFLIVAAAVAGGSAGVLACGGQAESNPEPQVQEADLQARVRSTEIAFAKTMADRDHGAFASFLSEETIFFNGLVPLRGKQAVSEAWAPFFDGPQAPFSWEPEVVEVLGSGTLAISSGPVKDPEGNRVGTFNSVWRLESNGEWKIIFDKGCPVPGQ